MDFAFPTFVRASTDVVTDEETNAAGSTKSLLDLVIEAKGNLGLVPHRAAGVRGGHSEDESEEEEGETSDDEFCLTTRTSWIPPRYLLDYMLEPQFMDAFYHFHGVRCLSFPINTLPPPLLSWRDMRLPFEIESALCHRLDRNSHPRQSGKRPLPYHTPNAEQLNALVLGAAASNTLGGSVPAVDELPPMRGIQQAALPCLLLGQHALLSGPRGCGKRTAALVAIGSLLLSRSRDRLPEEDDKEPNTPDTSCATSHFNITGLIIVSDPREIIGCSRFLEQVFGSDSFSLFTFERGSSEIVPVFRSPKQQIISDLNLLVQQGASVIDSAAFHEHISRKRPRSETEDDVGAAPEKNGHAQDSMQHSAKDNKETLTGSTTDSARREGDRGRRRHRDDYDDDSDDGEERRPRDRRGGRRYERGDSRSTDGHHRRTQHRSSRRHDSADSDDDDDDEDRARRRHHHRSDRHRRHRVDDDTDERRSTRRHDDSHSPRSRRHDHRRRDHSDDEERHHRSGHRSRHDHHSRRHGARDYTDDSDEEYGERRGSRGDRERRHRRDSRSRHHRRHYDDRRSDSGDDDDTAYQDVYKQYEEEYMKYVDGGEDPTAVDMGVPVAATAATPPPKVDNQVVEGSEGVSAPPPATAQTEAAVAPDEQPRRAVSVLVCSAAGLRDALADVGDNTSLLPLENVRMAAAFGCDVIFTAPFHSPQRQQSGGGSNLVVAPAQWISLVNSVDVDCQWCFVGDDRVGAVREFVANTILPDRTDALAVWEQEDASVWALVAPPRLHPFSVEAGVAEGPGEAAAAEGGGGGRRGRIGFEEIEAAKVAEVASLVLQHFAGGEAPWRGPRVVLFVATRREQESLLGLLGTVLRESTFDQRGALLRVTAAVADFAAHNAEILVVSDRQVELGCGAGGGGSSFFFAAARGAVAAGAPPPPPPPVELVIHYSLPRPAINELGAGGGELVTECLCKRSRGLLGATPPRAAVEALRSATHLLLMTEHQAGGRLGAQMRTVLEVLESYAANL